MRILFIFSVYIRPTRTAPTLNCISRESNHPDDAHTRAHTDPASHKAAVLDLDLLLDVELDLLELALLLPRGREHL